MGHVVVVGSINDDLVVMADRLPGPGETVAGTSVAHSAGGKGANQAVAAARAGASTVMVGCVGCDEAGERSVAGLAAAGVDVAAVEVVDDAPTGLAIVTVAGGENSIVVVPGANKLLNFQKIVNLLNLQINQDDVIVAQMETPLDATEAAFRQARAVGATTVLNPAPAAPVPADVLALVDHLVVNEHEVEIVLGVAADDLAADRSGARARLRADCRATVHLTLGAHGSLVLGAGDAVLVPGHRVEVVETTGAGDCVVGWLAAGLAAGVPVADAALRAGAAAALSVTRPGAAPSMPTAAEVDSFLGERRASNR